MSRLCNTKVAQKDFSVRYRGDTICTKQVRRCSTPSGNTYEEREAAESVAAVDIIGDTYRMNGHNSATAAEFAKEKEQTYTESVVSFVDRMRECRALRGRFTRLLQQIADPGRPLGMSTVKASLDRHEQLTTQIPVLHARAAIYVPQNITNSLRERSGIYDLLQLLGTQFLLCSVPVTHSFTGIYANCPVRHKAAHASLQRVELEYDGADAPVMPGRDAQGVKPGLVIFHMSNCPRRLTILSMGVSPHQVQDSGGAIAAQLAALGARSFTGGMLVSVTDFNIYDLHELFARDVLRSKAKCAR
ncbi:hypothetical protein GGX14DRAFT_406024 [Mycena pura]|uniref:Uncharacterized protein n=1 Tax=Mycena pura TaxID=153505 RepID=A0AAD6UR16_9AGAR|nr:hypothetical protein GGX14DRAFT_406024 [Mycena pura]